MSKLDTDLRDVEALGNFKTKLLSRKADLYRSIMEELNRQLYLKPSTELAVELRNARVRKEPLQKVATGSSEGPLGLPSSVKSLSGTYLRASEFETPILNDNGCAYEDPSGAEPADGNPVQYIAVLVEAVAALNSVPETVAAMKMDLSRNLSKVVQHTAMFVHEHLSLGPHQVGDSKNFAELLQLLFRQLKIVAILHQIAIDQFHRVVETRNIQIRAEHLYSIEDVWTQIQDCLSLVLNDYLDVKNAGIPSNIDSSNLTSNLSSYFAKKRPAKPMKKPQLFRFEWTSHAMEVNAYTKEQRLLTTPTLMTPVDVPEQIYVCYPSINNIISSYKPLMKFIAEVESKLGRNDQCQLRVFLDRYVNETFLPKTREYLTQQRDALLDTPDAWNQLISHDEMKRLGSTMPLLGSVVRLIELCEHVNHLMTAIPPFAEEFASFWLTILQEFNGSAWKFYEKLTKPQVDELHHPGMERRKISSNWAADEDISRLLKSLPNWISLLELSRHYPTTPFSPPSAATPSVENAEAVRKRNERESEILIGNLSMLKKIEDWEIIQDIEELKHLATVHESLEFFTDSVRRMLQELSPALLSKLKLSRTSNSSNDRRSSHGDEFEAHLMALDDMSSTCLLMLHLEVRVHCFYYLLPIARQTSYMLGGMQSQEIDPLVLNLNRNLVQLDEVLRATLQPGKVRYVFEGIGHLIGAIFTNSTHHVAKINDNGKKRMCRNIFAIQQCLSNITQNRETDLDRGRRFFELLYKSPDDILKGIRERGPEFSELEYNYLLALAVRSNQELCNEPGALDQRISRLREIMLEFRK